MGGGEDARGYGGAVKILSHPWLLYCSRFVLGAVFIVASVDKIAYPAAFAESITAYGLVPYPLVNLLALFIPWLELLCGLALLAGNALRPNGATLAALLALFVVAIASALLRGLTIDCGCFGKEHATPVSWMKVAEDCGLFLLALHVAWAGAPRGKKLPPDAPAVSALKS